MLTKEFKRDIANPISGMVFFALYIILHSYVLREPYAFAVTLAIIPIFQIILAKYSRLKIQNISFYIPAIGIMFAGILWFVASDWITDHSTYVLIAEIAIIIQLIILHFGKILIGAAYSKYQTFLEKVLINDFFLTVSLLKYVLIIHVILLFACKQITIGYHNEIADRWLHEIMLISIIFVLFFYQTFRTNYIVNKLNRDEWLPIVTEEGEVKGKIAKSVSTENKNKFLHPVVRIALICKGKIFLQEKSEDAVLDPRKLDHPFEKYVLFDHEVTLAAQNSIKRALGRGLEETKFVLKYVFENEITKRLVFLFTAELDDESQVQRTSKMKGKFWSVKQIDEEFENQIFSECFELEYEYLKHVVLLDDADEFTNLSRES